MLEKIVGKFSLQKEGKTSLEHKIKNSGRDGNFVANKEAKGHNCKSTQDEEFPHKRNEERRIMRVKDLTPSLSLDEIKEQRRDGGQEDNSG